MKQQTADKETLVTWLGCCSVVWMRLRLLTKNIQTYENLLKGMIGIKGKRRSTSWSNCSVTVRVKFTVWFLHWENSDRMICCYLTVRHHILRLCRCHSIHRCHFDWLEDNISSSAVVWHSLCDFITSSLAAGCASRAWPGPCRSIQLAAQWLWWDLLIM